MQYVWNYILNKKIIIFIAFIVIMPFSAMGSFAVDFKFSGTMEHGFYWSDHTIFNDLPQDKFGAASRTHLRFDVIADENLRGVYQVRIGTTSWGVNKGNGIGKQAGYGVGTQGVNIRTLDAYLSFRWPGASLNVRMGLMPVGAPAAVTGEFSKSFIFHERVAGIQVSHSLTRNISFTATWARLANLGDGILEKSERSSKFDLMMLAVPITAGSLKVTPWGMYGLIGRNAHIAATPNKLDTLFRPNAPDTDNGPVLNGKNGKIWWTGAAFDITACTRLFFKSDIIYGRYAADSMGQSLEIPDREGRAGHNVGAPKREGWWVDAQLGYKMDHMTPTLSVWYATGDKYNDIRRNKSGRIPILSNLSGLTSLGGFNSRAASTDGVDRKLMNRQGYTGTWGLVAGLERIRFLDKLTSYLRILYMRGTNSNEILRNWSQAGRTASPWYLGSKDSSWEFNFNHEYKLYEDMGLWVDLGYIILHRNKANKPLGSNAENHLKNAASIFTGFYYKF